MNKAIMIGRITADPEVRVTTTGKKVAVVTLATDRRMKNKDGEKVADFHTVVMWNKLADLAEKYLFKGDKLCVEGEIQNRTYEAKDGSKRYITEIIADEIEFLTPKGAKVRASEEPNLEGFTPVAEDEKLPF